MNIILLYHGKIVQSQVLLYQSVVSIPSSEGTFNDPTNYLISTCFHQSLLPY